MLPILDVASSPLSPTSFSEIVDPVEMPAAAIADPCTPAPDNLLHCKTLVSRTLPGFGRVDVRRVAPLDDLAGYGIEIVIVTEHDGMFVLPMIGSRSPAKPATVACPARRSSWAVRSAGARCRAGGGCRRSSAASGSPG